jgi:hypothetical protein
MTSIIPENPFGDFAALDPAVAGERLIVRIRFAVSVRPTGTSAWMLWRVRALPKLTSYTHPSCACPPYPRTICAGLVLRQVEGDETRHHPALSLLGIRSLFPNLSFARLSPCNQEPTSDSEGCLVLPSLTLQL